MTLPGRLEWGRRRPELGLTLLETLLVLGLALALAAVLMPLLSSAILQGKRSDDLQRLRQLGVAATLYQSETGHKAWSCAELADVRRVETSMCSSLADPTPEGFANIFRKQASKWHPTLTPKDYRLSFVGLRDVAGSTVSLGQGSTGGFGWLIDISGSNQDGYARAEPRLLLRRGSYRRLLEDGAVVQRTFKVVRRREAKNEWSWCFSPHWLYADYPDPYLQERCDQLWDPQTP